MHAPDEQLVSKVKNRLLIQGDLPSWMRETLLALNQNPTLIKGESYLRLEAKPVTDSYIAFLDLQIELHPRGEVHANLLLQRRKALIKHRGNLCLSVTVTDGEHYCFVWMTNDGSDVIWYDPFDGEKTNVSGTVSSQK